MTCTQCTCAALISNAVGWNCLTNNNTCQLISNYSSNNDYLIGTSDGSFFFQQFPSELSQTISYTTTSTTSSPSPSSATTSIIDIPSFWSFNNNTFDSLSGFNGLAVNSPTYQTPGIDGCGSALSVNRGSSQYVNVSSFRNLTNRSFTIDLWFYCTALTSADYGLVGQYYARTTDQSLHYIIRNYRLYLGFYGDDLPGSTIIQTNIWYHVAFVFDYSTLTQKIYVNGTLDAARSSNAYQGMGGALVIGKTEQTPGNPNYFSGYIDQVSFVMRTKTASEILDDATLVAWNAFDSLPYHDSGLLNLTVKAVNITAVNGRVNQAISFTSNSSYYQVNGFVLLGVSNNPFSIALWTRPLSINGAVLVHLSSTTTGQGWCLGYMGLSSTGQIVVSIFNGTIQQIVGPVLPANTWTHVVQTYSSANGLRLYVNATLIGTIDSRTNINSGVVDILTLGNSLEGSTGSSGVTCSMQAIVPNVYYGYIDEFRVYSRELTSTNIYVLANP